MASRVSGAATDSGANMFARFAYPPNELGLCGPDDSAALLEQAALPGAQTESDLRQIARAFEGAWPYLQFIAAANGRSDPLDLDVVTAYWLGNDLLDRVPAALFARSLEDRFRTRLGSQWGAVDEAISPGARPHHNFHVFVVYPWIGLLREGDGGEPLRILDRCRIRAGRVERVGPDSCDVLERPLVWDGRELTRGEPQLRSARWRSDGHTLATRPRPRQWVALHWDWVCQPIGTRQAVGLDWETEGQLRMANTLIGRRRRREIDGLELD